MGLGNSGNGKTYVQVVNGKLAVRVSKGVAGAVERVLTKGINEGKTIFETYHPYIDGKITKLTYETKPVFGASIKVEIDEKYIVSVPWKSSMKRNLVSQLPNIDFSLPLRINVFLDKENAKKNVMLVYQNNEMVKFAHTKTDPNGLPQPVETTILGEKKLDYTKVEEFLYNVLMAQIARFNEENDIEVEAVEEEPTGEDF